MCRELYDHRDWLWTFLEVAGVEPTNNAAERSLRQAAMWRKLSFGTQSASGSRFVQTLLTTIETCRQQERNVFEYVTTAVQAHFHGQTCPSLLPRAWTVNGRDSRNSEVMLDERRRNDRSPFNPG